MKRELLIGLIAIVVLYSGSKWLWGEASKAYFNYRCEQDAGEFIYRTVDNVKGIFQMRPREQRDYITSLRNGNLLEDPYGHTDWEAQRPWTLFLRYPSKPTYQYFETTQTPDLIDYDLRKYTRIFSKRPEISDAPYWRFTYHGLRKLKNSDEFRTMLQPEQVSVIKSQYGFTWRQFQSSFDKLFKVYGGELIVKELATNETLGIRRGYFLYSTWPKIFGGCPKGKHNQITYSFISKVLKPAVFDDSILEEKDYGY